MKRRDLLKAGSAAAGLNYLGIKGLQASQESKVSEKSVVWVWLGGGPTQFETFHAPTKLVPDEYRPVTGLLHDPKTGIAFGGLWEKLFSQTQHLNVVNSFTHKDSSHRQGTHFVMTGQYNPERANTANAKYPSYGSIASAMFGSNHSSNGVPTYVKQGTISGEEPAWLGGQYKAFDPSNKDNLTPRIQEERFINRGSLIEGLSKANVLGAESFDRHREQAYDVILGSAKKAFDVDSEPQYIKDLYGSSAVGQQLLQARRLVEYGTRFVTIHYGGWDMHSNIKKSLEGRVPEIDKALGAFVSDIHDRGLNEQVLLVVTGEFGRTKLNANSGRDHWPSISTLLLSGGNYEAGRVIGEADKSYSPISNPVTPFDLATLVFDHYGIEKGTQRIDNSGRPRYLLEGEGRLFL